MGRVWLVNVRPDDALRSPHAAKSTPIVSLHTLAETSGSPISLFGGIGAFPCGRGGYRDDALFQGLNRGPKTAPRHNRSSL
jgi:hypothetical protein